MIGKHAQQQSLGWAGMEANAAKIPGIEGVLRIDL